MFPHLNLNFAMRDFLNQFNKMNITSTQKADICKLIEGKNYAALGDMLAQFDDSREADVIKKLPRLFGDVSVIDEAKKLYNDEKSTEEELLYICSKLFLNELSDEQITLYKESIIGIAINSDVNDEYYSAFLLL